MCQFPIRTDPSMRTDAIQQPSALESNIERGGPPFSYWHLILRYEDEIIA
jgi:hypothetical protein